METQENGVLVFKDKILKCCDCGSSFKLSSGEQAFLYSKGLSEFKRCRACRELRKTTIVPATGVKDENPST